MVILFVFENVLKQLEIAEFNFPVDLESSNQLVLLLGPNLPPEIKFQTQDKLALPGPRH